MNTFTFNTYNDWISVKIGRYTIVAGDCLSHISRGGKARDIVGTDAEAWLKDHPDVLKAYKAWRTAREEALHAWKHETPHKRYSCDGGCLKVSINGVPLYVRNGYGDGDFPVYVIKASRFVDSDHSPYHIPTYGFKPHGISVEDVSGTLTIYGYDCGNNPPILQQVSISERDTVNFYTCRGAVAIVISTRD